MTGNLLSVIFSPEWAFSVYWKDTLNSNRESFPRTWRSLMKGKWHHTYSTMKAVIRCANVLANSLNSTLRNFSQVIIAQCLKFYFHSWRLANANYSKILFKLTLLSSPPPQCKCSFFINVNINMIHCWKLCWWVNSINLLNKTIRKRYGFERSEFIHSKRRYR